ncbi:hypothetical protein M3Y98_00713100 [Aphelenchoides besseyi]|nr:hypothetical protein M3Y98_00713100 [Aphelenchoides besseyi]KAI6210310.1 hypothetical protein M3Y96_00314500 [Aphelenchoides besseyi]
MKTDQSVDARSSVFHALLLILVAANLVQIGFLVHGWFAPQFFSEPTDDQKLVDLGLQIISAQSKLIHDLRFGEKEASLPINLQSLVFYGEMLKNKCTLEQIVEVERETVRSNRSILLIDTPDRQQIKLQISLGAPLAHLRSALQSHGYSRFQQKLSYHGYPLVGDDRRLFEFQLRNNSVIDLDFDTELLVYINSPSSSVPSSSEDESNSRERDSNVFVIGVNESTKMSEIKRLIVDSWPINDQLLRLPLRQQKDGYVLADQRPVADFDIYDRDVLEFVV